MILFIGQVLVVLISLKGFQVICEAHDQKTTIKEVFPKVCHPFILIADFVCVAVGVKVGAWLLSLWT